MEKSSSESTRQTGTSKPPKGGARPGGAPRSTTESQQGNWNGPAGFGMGGNDVLMPARLWVQHNQKLAVAGAFATGVLLGFLQK